MQNDKERFKKEFIERLIGFSISVIECTNRIDKGNLWPVKDQLIRSATSIGANVVEAQASSSKKDFVHFFEIALKSANETLYWLTILERVEQSVVAETRLLKERGQEIANIIAKSILTLKGK
ncbi:MAG: CHP02436-containing protein [Parcubacteria group bacterium GW2011_GWB1_46_8]|nr:MAG: hypothetical protein UV67_C0029G0007 [Parcubacteria group bacterium GW2011_GWC1_43_12]KKU09863.1 MAG: CHP02436-containing protein [Parcubacteria group bacterium GW2011_GWF1_45_5]KKU46034.1 MAG: CHP02436-containing protein [Parcubacteria group bacterium GW2011_GWB1_46_8]KKU47317.1 MAG: CHP02436-containing protein [Parcubacteria group bacterium GW2011_GWF2_46_8]